MTDGTSAISSGWMLGRVLRIIGGIGFSRFSSGGGSGRDSGVLSGVSRESSATVALLLDICIHCVSN